MIDKEYELTEGGTVLTINVDDTTYIHVSADSRESYGGLLFEAGARAIRAEAERDTAIAKVAYMDVHIRQNNELLTENEKLRAAIENAPHENGCGQNPDAYYERLSDCDCWKAEALKDG